jgi:hypothetical protein
MGRYASGKFALRISDRDGMAYPYNEMVQEWTGAWVHTSEYEPKSPLLNPRNHPTDNQALQHAKPQVANSTAFVGDSPGTYNASELVWAATDNRWAGGGFGQAVNSFQTLDEAFTAYHANGVAYVGTRKSMMPLSVQQPNKKTQLISRTGNVTVSIS